MLTNTSPRHQATWLRRARTSIAMAVALLAASATLPAADRAKATVTLPVFVYDYAGLSASELREATRTADRIFLRVGIVLAWTIYDDERLSRAAQNAGSEEAPANALFVHLRTPAMTENCRCAENVLGQAVPGSQQAFILTPRVRAFAERHRQHVSTVLGHVVAHEMGHLLLSPAGHTLAGLMSASLDVSAIARRDLGFSDSEAGRIRARLADGLLLARR